MPRPSFFEHLHPPTIPADQARFRYTLGLGGIGVFLFLVILLTGALLLFYYVPSGSEANASVQLLAFHVPLGWLVRNLHFWAAQGLLVVAALHLLRVALTGGSRRGRAFNWLLGLLLLLLVAALDFTGYVLRWDTGVGWALTVGTNLLRHIPLAGEALYRLAVGGPVISGATIVRFYGWHVFGLFLPAAIVLVWHLFRVRRDGGINRPVRPARDLELRISRKTLVGREVLAAILTGAALLAVSTAWNASLSGAFDPAQPAPEAKAPWFFLWVQELLRVGNPLWMGVVLPAVMVIIAALLPYGIDRGQTTGRWLPADGRPAQALVLALAALVAGLTLAGALR
jgi:quinol-cytochrome oxidoreductase complex cytochrome b subunit